MSSKVAARTGVEPPRPRGFTHTTAAPAVSVSSWAVPAVKVDAGCAAATTGPPTLSPAR